MINKSKTDVSFGKCLWHCFFVVFLIVAVLEGGLRIYELVKGEVLDEELRTQIELNHSNDHPYLQYTSQKSFRGWLHYLEPGKRFWVETNSDGFRTREFLPKSTETYRILLFGDSFVYGYNANQNETLAIKLEQELKHRVHKKIEVLSLGVASYSGVRYAMLAKLYLDKLKPDMVIVAVDQSDLEEDFVRINHYVLDQDGYPVILKKAQELMKEQGHHHVFIDGKGDLVIEDLVRDRLLDMRLASALYDHAYRLVTAFGNWRLKLRASLIKSKDYDNVAIEYEDLVAENGADLSAVLPKRLLADTIPYDLNTAIKRYEPTLRSLRYIKRETSARGIEMIITSYPYPWMVSIREALPYQSLGFDGIYDFRANRIHPEVVNAFASELGVPHLNAYPAFENQSAGLYGDYDPHFNARGYSWYAEFLSTSLAKHIRKDLPAHHHERISGR